MEGNLELTKNSIRHTLSLNESFVRAPLDPSETGKGAYWKLSSKFKSPTAPRKTTKVLTNVQLITEAILKGRPKKKTFDQICGYLYETYFSFQYKPEDTKWKVTYV
jgi:Forkhead domain